MEEKREERIQREGRGFAIASMVLGIVALVIFFSFINIILAILAIVFGVMVLRGYSKNKMAIAGIVTGILSLVLFVVGWAVILSNDAFVQMLEDELSNRVWIYQEYEIDDPYDDEDIDSFLEQFDRENDEDIDLFFEPFDRENNDDIEQYIEQYDDDDLEIL